MKKQWVMPTTMITIALLLSGCGGTTTESTAAPNNSSSNAGTPSDTAENDSSTPSASGSSFVDNVLTTPKMKIVITDHKVIPVGEKGNEYGEKPVIAFWYKTTNLTSGDVDPMNWLFALTAYQDNNPNAENELEVGSLPDARFRESQTEKIKKGGTVKNAMAYELDDMTTPVDLVASGDFGMTEIGKMTYKLK
jgi:hypothetical protein